MVWSGRWTGSISPCPEARRCASSGSPGVARHHHRSILGLVELPGKIVEGKILWRPQPYLRLSRRRRIRDGDAAATRSATSTPPPSRLDGSGEPSPRRPKPTPTRRSTLPPSTRAASGCADPGWRDRHDLPGADGVALAHVHHRRADGRSDPAPPAMDKKQARDRAIALLRQVGIPRPEQRIDAYSFQLSGGMCQRVMIAMALACGPSPADRRRTHHRAGRHHAGPDPRPDQNLQQQTGDGGPPSSPTTWEWWPSSQSEVVVMYLGMGGGAGAAWTRSSTIRSTVHQARCCAPSRRMGAGYPATGCRRSGAWCHHCRRPKGCPIHRGCDDAISGSV